MGKRQRLKKEQRKNMKGWAEGARAELLDKHVLGYADALERGYMAEDEFLRLVFVEYHFIIDWRLADHEDPPRPWPAFDPKIAYVPEVLSDEDAKKKSAAREKTNERIKRWLRYRVRKLNKKRLRLRRDHLNDPYTILLAQLVGITKPPKARQAYQEWMVEDGKNSVAMKTKERWDEAVINGATGGPRAGIRMGAARDLFAELTEAERAGWKDRAKETAEANKHEYQNALKAPPSKDPRERQLCISGLPAFAAPILKGIHERTGLNVVLLVGGPIPSEGGEIGTMNLAYGKNQEPMPVPWPKWKEQEFKGILTHYRDFLSTVYSEGDRKAAALPSLGDDAPLIQDEGLYMLEEDFPGLTENLDDVSDSLDDDISSSDDEAPRKKRKQGPKPSDGNWKKRAVVKDDDAPAKTKANDSNKENDSGTSIGSTKGKQHLSAYERQRLENIENIRNDPRMKELNEEIRQLQEERRPP
ncbi:hypothetical protein ARMSODRAFT_1023752 [Armillaria solidipes]|uniref:Uncharacterized protein n=1 Tax=Armillaria solidipes TaxID=1076256 RepID=A0A2H3AYW2_9AGAR|nr:hypothetical protein ARMSODRAFT_1023752 [Armillaria solidipes]